MPEFKVTPWEVKGKINYEKLIKRFGVKPLTEELLREIKRVAGELHLFLRRKYFFSHIDLEEVLTDYKDGRGFFLYTGRGPSGPMHLGHILPFCFVKWLQDRFKVNVYIELTDDEKFVEPKRKLSLSDVRKWSYENTLDIIATGLDENKTFIFQDTEYIRNVYPLALKIAKKINFSVAKAVFGFSGTTNVGLIFFPALQIVPTFFEQKRCLIPAGIDQTPYWRIQRDLAENFGHYKAAQIHNKFIPSLLGPDAKMSASDPRTAIYLSDDEKTVRNKVYSYAFSGGQPTVELHRKLGGNPEVDVSFLWLRLFEESDKKIEQIEADYRSGKLLTGELKDMLIEKLNEFLEKHKEKRAEAKELIRVFKEDGKLAREMREKIFE